MDIAEQAGRIMRDAMDDRMDYDISGLLAKPYYICRRLTWRERIRALFGHEVVARFEVFEYKGGIVVKNDRLRVKGGS